MDDDGWLCGTETDWTTLIGCCCRRADWGGVAKRVNVGDDVSRVEDLSDRTLPTIRSYWFGSFWSGVCGESSLINGGGVVGVSGSSR